MSAHNAAGLAPPARTHDEASALLRRPFAPGAIGFRAMSKVPWNGDPWGGAQVAAYIGAQSVLQRLNCVVPGRWRMTFTGVLLAGDPSDFLGQFNRNSHVSAGLRFSF